jgi:hypothetical protein
MVSRRTAFLGSTICIHSYNGLKTGQVFDVSNMGIHIFFQALLADGGRGGFLLAHKTRHSPVAIHRDVTNGDDWPFAVSDI